MRSISYRARQRLGTGLKVLLILAAVVLLLVLIAIVYLGRYVVYTPDGAYLYFGRNTALPAATGGAGHAAPAPPESVEIEYADPNISQQTAERIDGYYIDLSMLSDPDAVLQAIAPAATAKDKTKKIILFIIVFFHITHKTEKNCFLRPGHNNSQP